MFITTDIRTMVNGHVIYPILALVSKLLISKSEYLKQRYAYFNDNIMILCICIKTCNFLACRYTFGACRNPYCIFVAEIYLPEFKIT